MEILDCIGKTPLVKLPDYFTHAKSEIFIKLEEFNLGGSIKSRVGYQMIIDAEKDRRIDINNPEKVVILEATGGNTGIGIAQICALRKYRCVLIVPDNYSKIRVNLLKEMGAEVVLSDHSKGNQSHIRMAYKIFNDHPKYVFMNQFKNPSNVRAHYLGTGQEFLSQIAGKIDCLVAGIGSGGTITGTGRAIKEKYPFCKIIGVQPSGCDVLKGHAISHIIQGIAIGHIPEIIEKELIDGMIDVSNEEVIDMKNRICKSLGLHLGFSSIANIIGAINVANNIEKNKVIVTIAPDGGRNY